MVYDVICLHAAGHLHYARSAQVYLQVMLNLANIMAPDEYDRFISRELFTVRLSDKYWRGMLTDMTIEQLSEIDRRCYSWSRHIAVNHSQIKLAEGATIPTQRRS